MSVTRNIMEELWYGNVRPQEVLMDDQEIQRITKHLKNVREHFEKTMTIEQKNLFAQYETIYMILHELIEKDAFLYGMRLGVQIATTAFDNQ